LVPAARIAALFGTQYQKAALRVVPPSLLAFSSTSTSLPCQWENRAVARPATPLPIVMTSTSASNLPLAAAGAEDLRAMVAKRRPPLVLFAEIAAVGMRRSFKFRFLSNPEKLNCQKMLSGWGRWPNIISPP